MHPNKFGWYDAFIAGYKEAMKEKENHDACDPQDNSSISITSNLIKNHSKTLDELKREARNYVARKYGYLTWSDAMVDDSSDEYKNFISDQADKHLINLIAFQKIENNI
jgi:DNA uptake protein ComE-like DNA-binding protein